MMVETELTEWGEWILVGAAEEDTEGEGEGLLLNEALEGVVAVGDTSLTPERHRN